MLVHFRRNLQIITVNIHFTPIQFFRTNYQTKKMEKQNLTVVRRRKHKTDIFVLDKAKGRIIKPKRLSCMGASEYLIMEESKINIANHCIDQILQRVFEFVNQAKIISELCLKQMDGKFELIQNFDFFNMESILQQIIPIVRLQEQPRIQKKYKVSSMKQKIQEQCSHANKKELTDHTNISSNNKSNQKNLNKQKMLKLTNLLNSNHSSRSIMSIRSKRGNSFSLISNRNQSVIEEEKQKSKEKQKRQKQEIIKKLMKQHQEKLKKSYHFGPQPIMQQYRSLFTQPETRQQQDMRSSFVHLRQIKEMQENLNHKKGSKSIFNSMLISGKTKQDNLRTTKLPTIHKSGKIDKSQDASILFTQDQNGSIIKVKNPKKIDSFRQHSSTLHETSTKPQVTKFKEVSNILKSKYEHIKNDKIKNQSNLMNQNLSIVSTICQSVDEEEMQRSVLENFSQQKGVILKKSTYTHQPSMSGQFGGLKLPSILMKNM